MTVSVDVSLVEYTNSSIEVSLQECVTVVTGTELEISVDVLAPTVINVELSNPSISVEVTAGVFEGIPLHEWDGTKLRFQTKQGWGEFVDLGEAGNMPVYTKRIDFVGDTIVYKGDALPGTLTNEPLWRISRITLSNDGDVKEEWAEGSSSFIHIWNNRLSLNYV